MKIDWLRSAGITMPMLEDFAHKLELILGRGTPERIGLVSTALPVEMLRLYSSSQFQCRGRSAMPRVTVNHMLYIIPSYGKVKVLK